METIPENKNILEILEEKLDTFRNKQQKAEETLNEKKERELEIQTQINQLQRDLETNKKEMEIAEQDILKTSAFLEEIESGYKSLVESGNCLMQIVKNAQ